MAIALSMALFVQAAQAAGVTLVTHGNSGNTDGWVTGMANALSQRLGGSLPIYRINVTSNAAGFSNAVVKISGGLPTASASGEIIVLLDWRTLANNSFNTFQVANSVAPVLAQTNFIAELGGHALAEFPLHLLGHSRGGSLVCELSQRLGETGIWVDQVTTLDAHPISGDAPVRGYENLLFADSYYELNSFLHLTDGEPIPNAHYRRQTVASGGYASIYDWHSDVHLWYHGTIDLSPTASDTEVAFTSAMRDAWWTAVEQKGTNAGFIYSRLGGGNRFSSLQPNGANSSAVNAGLNRNFDIGAGIGANRTALMFNQGNSPNVIRLDLLSTNPVPQGGEASLQIYYQWAKPASSNMTVEVWRDADANPLNGNEALVKSGTASGTTATTVVMGTIPVLTTNIPAGTHRLFVKLADGNRRRLLYAAQSLQVVANTAPPWLDIASTGSGALVGVNGWAGQGIVLERSPGLLLWYPFATNVLSGSRWEVPVVLVPTNEFFRARLLP